MDDGIIKGRMKIHGESTVMVNDARVNDVMVDDVMVNDAYLLMNVHE